MDAPLTNVADLQELQSVPTRGRSKLDIIYSSVNNNVQEVERPTPTASSFLCDHGCVSMKCCFDRVRDFVWEVRMKR